MSLRLISGKFGGRILFAPKNTETRPSLAAVRAAVFNICQLFIEETVFLDLFAGSGAMGFEALSRGAKKVFFIERNFAAIESIKKNIQLLQVESQAEILQGDASTLLKRLAKEGIKFDIIYMDPPYSQKDQENNLLIIKSIALIEEYELLAKGGRLFIEESSYRKGSHEVSKVHFKDQRRIGNCQLFQYEY